MRLVVLPVLTALTLLSGLGGCSLGGDAVDFAPGDGAERVYRFYSRAQFKTTHATQPDDVVMESSGLLRYTAHAGDTPVSVQPLHFCIEGAPRSRAYCSSWTGDRAPDLRRVLTAGLDIGSDAARHPWAQSSAPKAMAALRDDSEDLARLLPRQFAAPGVFADVPTTSGAEKRIHIAGLPATRLTVVATTPRHVFVSLSAADDGDQMAGYAVIERDGGWIERMVVVYSSRTSMGGQNEPVRQLLVLAPSDWPAGSLRIDSHTAGVPAAPADDQEFAAYMSLASTPSEAKLIDDVTGHPDTPALTEAEVFPSAVGGFKAESAWGLELHLGHALWRDRDDRFGRLQYSNPIARDAQGNRLDLPIAGSRPKTAATTLMGSLQTDDRLLPLGFKNIAERLNRTAAVTAHAAYFPRGPIHTLTLPRPADDAPVTRSTHDNGITATLTHRHDDLYTLQLSAAGHYISQLMLPAEYTRKLPIRRVDPAGAGWVSPGERELFDTILGNGSDRLMWLRLDDDIKSLSVQLLAFADQPAFEKDVRFVPRKARYNALDLPPAVHVPLHADDDFAREDEAERVVADDELAPKAMDSGAPIFFLSPRQSAMCTLSATRDGQPGAARWQVMLHKRPVEDGGDRQLPGVQIWRLLGPDRGPANADGALELGLRCHAGAWQPADYDLGQRPWLIDLRALLGHPPDGDMPLPVLLGRYRFLDAEGTALSVLPAEYDGYWDHEPGASTLAPFLVDGHYLRVAGQPVAVETRQPARVTVDKHWHLPTAGAQ